MTDTTSRVMSAITSNSMLPDVSTISRLASLSLGLEDSLFVFSSCCWFFTNSISIALLFSGYIPHFLKASLIRAGVKDLTHTSLNTAGTLFLLTHISPLSILICLIVLDISALIFLNITTSQGCSISVNLGGKQSKITLFAMAASISSGLICIVAPSCRSIAGRSDGMCFTNTLVNHSTYIFLSTNPESLWLYDAFTGPSFWNDLPDGIPFEKTMRGGITWPAAPAHHKIDTCWEEAVAMVWQCLLLRGTITFLDDLFRANEASSQLKTMCGLFVKSLLPSISSKTDVFCGVVITSALNQFCLSER